MKKAVLASALALSSMGVYAADDWIAATYLDNDTLPDHVYSLGTDGGNRNKFLVEYSDLGPRRIEITGLNGRISSFISTVFEDKINVSTKSGTWGYINIPKNGASTTPFIPGDFAVKWANVGLIPCLNNSQKCPVKTFKGKYWVDNGRDFHPRTPEPWLGDMCFAGNGEVVYNEDNNKFYLNCYGQGRIAAFELKEGRGTVPAITGEHVGGFSLRAADPEHETGSLFLINREENQIGFISHPWADGRMYFHKFYAVDTDGDWQAKLAPAGLSYSEPNNAIDVGDYGFFTDGWFSADQRILDAAWNFIRWVFNDPDAQGPVAGCKTMVDWNGDPKAYVRQSHGQTAQTHPDCFSTQFKAEFNFGTAKSSVQQTGPTYCEDATAYRYWPRKVWIYPPFGVHRYWGKLPSEATWKYWGCTHHPVPREV